MNFGIYLKKLFNLDSADDFVFLSSEYIPNLNNDTFIEGTKVLGGINNCNLILKQDANIEIEKVFHGKIIGLGNNIVRIRGEFVGTVSCHKLVIFDGGIFDGKIWTKLFAIENKKFSVKGEFKSGDLISPSIPLDKIDFDYINQF